MVKDRPLAFVLGGGQGKRLDPLTRSHSKPSLPFLGTYRVIDFVLSNLYNSGVGNIEVLTQYASGSLQEHLNNGWIPRWGTGHRSSLTVSPATQTLEGGWFKGTADAIYQRSSRILNEKPTEVNVFGGDHIYLMEVEDFNHFHQESGADMTISVIPVRRELAAGNYGVLVVNEQGKVTGFEEKPENPTPIPGNEDYCLTSMGNYAFKPGPLLEELLINSKKEDGTKEEVAFNPGQFTTNDFGFDIIPAMIRDGREVYAYDFTTNMVPGAVENERGFWRDIGNLDQFYLANMELKEITPILNLRNKEWPVLSNVNNSFQPAVMQKESECDGALSPGCILTGSSVMNSILGYDVQMEYARAKDSILMGDTFINDGAQIYKAIIDRHVEVPAGTHIGFDHDYDKSVGLTVSPDGITAVPSKFRWPGQKEY